MSRSKAVASPAPGCHHVDGREQIGLVVSECSSSVGDELSSVVLILEHFGQNVDQGQLLLVGEVVASEGIGKVSPRVFEFRDQAGRLEAWPWLSFPKLRSQQRCPVGFERRGGQGVSEQAGLAWHAWVTGDLECGRCKVGVCFEVR